MSPPAISRFLESLTDVVFPPRCAGCGDWHKGLFCEPCLAQLRVLRAPLCEICGAPFDTLAAGVRLCIQCRVSRYGKPPDFAALRSVFYFDGPVRHAIHQLKYEAKTSLAVPLGKELALFWKSQCLGTLEDTSCDMITAVPLHWWRSYRRGYNQSNLLAQHLSKELNLPLKVLLKRTRHTQPQVEMQRDQRNKNVKGAFALVREQTSIKGKSVLIIDDVCTSGATLRECAKALHKGGAKRILALTLARAVPQVSHTVEFANNE